MPKRRVESVSDSLYDDGEQLMINVVRELPPSDSWRIRVNLESRYGICLALRIIMVSEEYYLDYLGSTDLAIREGVDDHTEC